MPLSAADQRLDVFLTEATGLTRSRVTRLIKEGHCTIHPGLVRAGRPLTGGERVTLDVPPTEAMEVLAEDIPLNVLHEDAHLIAIDKPAGMVVHPATGHRTGTLVHALLGRYGPGFNTGFAPDPEDDDAVRNEQGEAAVARPGIVHRLDEDTSGVIVVARTPEALAFLQGAFRDRLPRKRYLALIAGRPRGDLITCDEAIGRHPRDPRLRATHTPTSPHFAEAREAHTTVLILARTDGYAVAEARPKTGRTHQVRVHLAHAGHPVLADRLYGRSPVWPLGAEADDPKALHRHALHAWTLEIPHPNGGVLKLEAPIPADLAPWVPGGTAYRPY